MIRQFTATVYIVDDRQRILLLLHPKLNKWLPPGGHVDPHELPSHAAIREAYEETGLEIALYLQENIWVKKWNASSFPRPFLCLAEEIPAFGTEPAHQHLDMIYVGHPCDHQMNKKLKNCAGECRWFTWQEILKLRPDEDIFAETQQVIESVLKFTAQDSMAIY